MKKDLKHCSYIWIVIVLFSLHSANGNEAPIGFKTLNIILIMADDLGYETIGANGGESYQTPSLDRLAAAGARFEHCYAQPLCTPSRVQIMTGKYNIRIYTNFGTTQILEHFREKSPPSLISSRKLATPPVSEESGNWELKRTLLGILALMKPCYGNTLEIGR